MLLRFLMLVVQAAYRVFAIRPEPTPAERESFFACAQDLLPTHAALRSAGVSSFGAWLEAPALAAPALALATTDEDRRLVWGLVDLTCALRSPGVARSTMPRVRSVYSRALEGAVPTADASVPAAPGGRSCIDRALSDCFRSLGLRATPDARRAADELLAGADASAKGRLAQMAPRIVARAMNLSPSPTLRG